MIQIDEGIRKVIYFVVAQKEQDGEWKLFGPDERIEKADEKIAELENDPAYSQVELARVLTDEDGPDWLRDPPSVPWNVIYPDHWPSHYNGNSEPCGMIEGPCGCGAWHSMDENWVKEMIDQYGLPE
jgi:hypothetical protein